VAVSLQEELVWLEVLLRLQEQQLVRLFYQSLRAQWLGR
jgi:hypothetical protein